MKRIKRKGKSTRETLPKTIDIPLMPEELMFVIEYINNKYNPIKALKKSGLLPARCTEEHKQQVAQELMKDSRILAAIKEEIEHSVKRIKTTENKVLAELYDMLNFDPASLFDENNELKDLKDLPVDVRKNITSIEVQELFSGRGGERRRIGTLKKVKWTNRIEAIKTLLDKVFAPQQKIAEFNQYNINNSTNQSLNINELSKEQVKVLLDMVSGEKNQNLLDMEAVEAELLQIDE